MKLHERHIPFQQAKSEISKVVEEAVEKHNLTYGELFSILANELRSWAGCVIRDERDEEK